jgi:hypothetical protein
MIRNNPGKLKFYTLLNTPPGLNDVPSTWTFPDDQTLPPVVCAEPHFSEDEPNVPVIPIEDVSEKDTMLPKGWRPGPPRTKPKKAPAPPRAVQDDPISIALAELGTDEEEVLTKLKLSTEDNRRALAWDVIFSIRFVFPSVWDNHVADLIPMVFELAPSFKDLEKPEGESQFRFEVYQAAKAKFTGRRVRMTQPAAPFVAPN